MSDAEPTRPALRVVRGTPSDEELAALVVVLRARSAAPAAPAPPVPSGWTVSARGGRSLPPPGPDAWRRSARA